MNLYMSQSDILASIPLYTSKIKITTERDRYRQTKPRASLSIHLDKKCSSAHVRQQPIVIAHIKSEISPLQMMNMKKLMPHFHKSLKPLAPAKRRISFSDSFFKYPLLARSENRSSGLSKPKEQCRSFIHSCIHLNSSQSVLLTPLPAVVLLVCLKLSCDGTR